MSRKSSLLIHPDSCAARSLPFPFSLSENGSLSQQFVLHSNICFSKSNWHMSDAVSCLQRGWVGNHDVCREEKARLCPPDEGMWPLVSIHFRHCVRGLDLCGSVAPYVSPPVLSACCSHSTKNCRRDSMLAAQPRKRPHPCTSHLLFDFAA